ncbi:MAG: PcfJ domain-containing protein [Dysosmobacter sp.]|nr:PcfJ domain-containing protein [Dysosmobacter sp.]
MRHEKKLLAVPVPPCPDLPQRERVKISSYAYAYHIRYAAETAVVDGEKVLAVTTFDVEGKPCRRFWQVGEQDGVETFRKEQGYGANKREPGRMYGASIDHFYEGICPRWYGGNETNFYGEPEGFKEWCEAVPMAGFRYFFYTYTGKKVQEGICSYCGKRSSVSGIRNWKMGTCPSCGSWVRFWSMRRLNASHGIDHRIDAAACEVVNGRIVVRKFAVGIDLIGNGETFVKNIWCHEKHRSFLDGKTATELERYSTPTGTTKVYVDGLCKDDSRWGLDPCCVSPVNIEEIRKGLGLYAPLEELAARGCAMDPVRVWRAVPKKPEVEYLIKLGLYRLAENELKNAKTDVLNKSGRNVAELLGVPKETVNILRSVDPTARALIFIRGLIKCGATLKEQDMRDINELGIGWSSIQRFQLMLHFGSVHKTLRYIRTQMESCKAFSDADHVLQTWDDYTSMAMKAGKDIDDSHVALPKALKAAHDETAKILRMQKDKKLNEAVGRSAKKLRDLCWTWNGLTIRPAESQEELFQEGEKLNHCVGRMGYADKMARFQTAIFFIRKEKEPDVPYVTLELDLKKWDKLQCYGKGDTWAGKQVNSFVKKWLKDVVKPARCGEQTKTA